MRQKRKRYFLTSLLAVLCVGIGFWGYATAQTPATEQQAKNKAAELAIKEENILIQGAVTHVREPDGSSNAIIDIVIGNEFKGALPDEIDTITVAGPKGTYQLERMILTIILNSEISGSAFPARRKQAPIPLRSRAETGVVQPLTPSLIPGPFPSRIPAHSGRPKGKPSP
jgi:hypothetical protein